MPKVGDIVRVKIRNEWIDATLIEHEGLDGWLSFSIEESKRFVLHPKIHSNHIILPEEPEIIVVPKPKKEKNPKEKKQKIKKDKKKKIKVKKEKKIKKVKSVQ